MNNVIFLKFCVKWVILSWSCPKIILGQAFISRSARRIFSDFALWQGTKSRFFHSSKISKTILVWIKWAVLAWLWPKIMEVNTSGSALMKNFVEWYGTISKIFWVKFPKKIFFWVKWAILAQLWPKIMQVYISGSTLGVFLSRSKLLKWKSTFWWNTQFWSNLAPKLHKLLTQDPL